MKKNLVLLGAGGNSSVIISTLMDINKKNEDEKWELLGVLDDSEKKEIYGFPILGKIKKKIVEKYLQEYDCYFYWTLQSSKIGKSLIPKLLSLDIPTKKFANIIHPTAVISRFSKIGYGVSIQPFVNIGPGVNIGNFVHIFANSMIGHNANLEDFSYLANKSSIGAYVEVRKGAYIGTNACIRENVCIGEWSLVGMGSVVLKNVKDGETVVGVPAKGLIRK